jgi:CheY-like chemotaxis protein
MAKILVIEDDDVMRELMRMALERHGYQVVLAADGVQGFELALETTPDLIITDITMPGADGVHLIRRIRDTNAVSKIPILVTTGYGLGTATFAMSEGATAYEPKPINPEAFIATVRRLLRER